MRPSTPSARSSVSLSSTLTSALAALGVARDIADRIRDAEVAPLARATLAAIAGSLEGSADARTLLTLAGDAVRLEAPLSREARVRLRALSDVELRDAIHYACLDLLSVDVPVELTCDDPMLARDLVTRDRAESLVLGVCLATMPERLPGAMLAPLELAMADLDARLADAGLHDRDCLALGALDARLVMPRDWA